MRTYRPRFFCFPGLRATSVAAESEPALHNLLIFHRIIKRFEKKLKGILFGEIDYFLAAFPGILHRLKCTARMAVYIIYHQIGTVINYDKE